MDDMDVDLNPWYPMVPHGTVADPAFVDRPVGPLPRGSP